VTQRAKAAESADPSGSAKKEVKSIKLLKEEAEKGDVESRLTLGYNGIGVTKNEFEVVMWGNAETQLNFGNMYFYGQGVTKNYEMPRIIGPKMI